MPVVSSAFSTRLSAFKQTIFGLLTRRFETKAARFSLAVSSGFVVVAAGFLVLDADPKSGVAQSIFGVMDLGGGAPPPAYEAPPAPSPQYYSPRQHHARRKSSHPLRYAHAGGGDRDRPAVVARPVSLARKSMCVRLCDGFVFPVGDYHGDGDRAAHESTCQSECPGAPTALFIVPQGSDSIGDATKVGSDLNYSEMPEAFHYTTFVDETCSCHPRSGNRIKSLLHDFTLRRGDAVMTSKGMRVFHGGGSYPFKRKDFVALSKTRDLRKGDRENLKAIERASLVTPTTVASAAPPALSLNGRPDSTKLLQHQAKN